MAHSVSQEKNRRNFVRHSLNKSEPVKKIEDKYNDSPGEAPNILSMEKISKRDRVQYNDNRKAFMLQKYCFFMVINPIGGFISPVWGFIFCGTT